MRPRTIALSLCLLASCARIPEHELAPITQNAGCKSLKEESIASGEWPADRWWEEMHDPVLTDLIERALRASPTLKKAEERLKAACQVALQKRAALFPQVNVEITDLWAHLSKDGFFRAFAPTVPDVVNDFFIGLSFSYEFDFWGKNRDLWKAALGETCARAAERKQAELILTTSIAYTYAELQFLLTKRDLLQERSSNRSALTGVRSRRETNALDTAMDPLFSKAMQLNVDALLAESSQEIAEQIHKLKQLSGIGQDGKLDVQLMILHPLKVALPENLSMDLLGRRPDLVAQRLRAEAAGRVIDAKKTDFYPNINLYGLLGFDGVFWDKLFKKGSLDAGLIPAFHLPIFTAGRLQAQLMEAVAEYNEAVRGYEELILRAAQEVADGLTKVVFLQKEIEVRKGSLQVAEKQRSIVTRRMEHALDTRGQFLDACDEVLDKQLTLASLEYGQQLAQIALIRALGGGFHE